MPKTEVILVQNVVGLGAESDQVKVSSGYARNFLIPQGLAIPETQSNKRRLESLKQRRAERESVELNNMSELGRSLSKVTLTISVKTGEDGKMFGSVTSGSIVDALRTQMDVMIEKKKIHLERPIHTLGEHEIELRLHPEVKSTLKVVVNSSNPAPLPVVTPEAEVAHSEKRSARNAGGRKADGDVESKASKK
jgi:large subunit ribosomal protein L9